jgi:hypothetical protein
MCHLLKVAEQLRIELSELIETLKTLYRIVSDNDFVQSMLSINFNISDLSKDN